MRCSLVHKLSSAYLDGELDDARSSALRGHLRTCPSCAEMVADEQTAVRAAAELCSTSDPNFDPPAELWAAIGQRLAEEEIADASAAPTLLRLRSMFDSLRPYRAHLAVALVLSIVGGALVVKEMHNELLLPRVAVTSVPAPVFAATTPETNETHFEATMREMRRADDRYMTAITDLRELAGAEREGWSQAAQDRFDKAVDDFEAEARELREALPAKVADPRTRDGLYDLYRRHIKFLESVVFDQMSALSPAGDKR